jgi:hypothetical protein
MQVRGSLAHDGALFVFGSLAVPGALEWHGSLNRNGTLVTAGSLAFNEADIESWLTSACWCSDMYLGSFSFFGALCSGDSLLYQGALIDYG